MIVLHMMYLIAHTLIERNMANFIVLYFPISCLFFVENTNDGCLYSARITISCRMNFDDYPLDAHTCQFQVGSCKYYTHYTAAFYPNQ